VNIDRRRILQQWSNAKRAAANQNLPPEVRAWAKKARDYAAMVLGMQVVEMRKAERTPASLVGTVAGDRTQAVR
jgi:hypothetical protein